MDGRGGEPALRVEKNALLTTEPIVPLAALDTEYREADGYVSRQVIPLLGEAVEQLGLWHDRLRPIASVCYLVCHFLVLSFCV
jgi:hypothetical protein